MPATLLELEERVKRLETLVSLLERRSGFREILGAKQDRPGSKRPPRRIPAVPIPDIGDL